jgi:hypothetical protein
MKYLITESQLDNTIFRYLYKQNFSLIENDESIYFADSNDNESAEIRFDKEDGYCEINVKLIDRISDFFSLTRKESIDKICSWVESATGMNIGHFHAMYGISIYI